MRRSRLCSTGFFERSASDSVCPMMAGRVSRSMSSRAADCFMSEAMTAGASCRARACFRSMVAESRASLGAAFICSSADSSCFIESEVWVRALAPTIAPIEKRVATIIHVPFFIRGMLICWTTINKIYLTVYIYTDALSATNAARGFRFFRLCGPRLRRWLRRPSRCRRCRSCPWRCRGQSSGLGPSRRSRAFPRAHPVQP